MKYSLLTALLVTLSLLVNPINQATASPSFSDMHFAQSSQSLEQAVQAVKQQTGGRILSTKIVNKDGKKIYKIKVLLPSGKVQVFHINAS